MEFLNIYINFVLNSVRNDVLVVNLYAFYEFSH